MIVGAKAERERDGRTEAPSTPPLQSPNTGDFSASLTICFTMSDDEPVDPKQELEERCKAPCTRPLKEYQACAKRIQGDESGTKHCTGQYFDYWRCVDKCVATKLFTHLK
ncbi:Ubiquinol-cytochrome C reductase hinge protein [Abeliophyllum distichum]|uniref:Complex III subunit VI n=1 Tax=Abeliophyllum distichum TaxID=126358 RepID=A0ABD1P9D0_9LAMI